MKTVKVSLDRRPFRTGAPVTANCSIVRGPEPGKIPDGLCQPGQVNRLNACTHAAAKTQPPRLSFVTHAQTSVETRTKASSFDRVDESAFLCTLWASPPRTGEVLRAVWSPDSAGGGVDRPGYPRRQGRRARAHERRPRRAAWHPDDDAFFARRACGAGAGHAAPSGRRRSLRCESSGADPLARARFVRAVAGRSARGRDEADDDGVRRGS